MGPEKGVDPLNSTAELLQKKLTELLSWERRKRREQILVTVVCYSLFAALVALPFYRLLPHVFSRALVPITIFVLLAPLWLFNQRWRRADSTRALARLDKALSLDERALTAWELLERNETRAAALLVLKEAGEKLADLNPRSLFRRRWSRQAYLAPGLLLLWLGLLGVDFDLRLGRDAQPPVLQTTAQKLRQFSRGLQEKAKNEGLRESLQMGRELEKVAQKGIDSNTGDDKFKTELAGMTKKIATIGKSAGEPGLPSAAKSQQDLEDLRAELQAARDLLKIPDGTKAPQEAEQSWLDRLATLPQLHQQLEGANPSAQGLSRNNLQSLLDKLEKQVTGELDRRTLLDAQQFLEQLMKQGEGDKGENNLRTAGQGERDSPADGERAKNRSPLPGEEPGKKEAGSPSLPEFQAGAAAHVKGLLGEGSTSGLALKAKPSPGKSEVTQEEVIASYRRQAEAELNTERVPEALKDAIKNYFLSLGMGEAQK
jgi:hypothetical protein